jgi:hypothetical protein
MDATFENGQIVVPYRPVAGSLAEKLRRHATGGFARDVAMVTRSAGDPISLDGAPSTADVMEDTLLSRRSGLIHPNPREQTATLDQALRLSGSASFGATSAHSQFPDILREARND